MMQDRDKEGNLSPEDSSNDDIIDIEWEAFFPPSSPAYFKIKGKDRKYPLTVKEGRYYSEDLRVFLVTQGE